MINGKLETLKDYKGLNPDLAVAIDYLMSTDLEALPVGKTVVNDKTVISKLVNFGKEPGQSKAELHRNHLDLQIVLHGREKAYFDYLTPEVEANVAVPYDEAKDVIKYNCNLRHMVVMDKDNFTLFTPTDVHMPSQKIDDEEITKLVIKVAL